VLPDSARELKARLSRLLSEAPPGSVTTSAVDDGELAGSGAARWSGVALGLAPVGPRSVHLAIRLVDRADAEVVLAGLGDAARAEVDVRVIGPVRALSSPATDQLERRVRPLRPGLSVSHPDVTAGTLGGFVRRPGSSGLLALSNNHVLANGGAAREGDPALQPGVAACSAPSPTCPRRRATWSTPRWPHWTRASVQTPAATRAARWPPG
jgi:hypothetical protein